MLPQKLFDKYDRITLVTLASIRCPSHSKLYEYFYSKTETQILHVWRQKSHNYIYKFLVINLIILFVTLKSSFLQVTDVS